MCYRCDLKILLPCNGCEYYIKGSCTHPEWKSIKGVLCETDNLTYCEIRQEEYARYTVFKKLDEVLE